MKKLIHKVFTTATELTEYVNTNNIWDSEIMSITYNSVTGEYILFYIEFKYVSPTGGTNEQSDVNKFN